MRSVGFFAGLTVGSLGFVQMASATSCAFPGIFEYAPLSLVSLVDGDDTELEMDEFEELSWKVAAGDGDTLEIWAQDENDNVVVQAYFWKEGGE